MADLDLKESSNLHWARYDEPSQNLQIDFKNSKGQKVSTYEYSAFTPEDWWAFQQAKSRGKHFAYSIKPLYDKGGPRAGLCRKLPLQVAQ